jgi:mannose-6-phosphate isomerase-like protein (cupin superfamily)
MSADAADHVTRVLAEGMLAPAGQRDFVLAEWSDDGSRPGEPMAPPHVHHDDDEAWYVLEGAMRFWIGDDTFDVSAGGAVLGPKGVRHTFANAGPGVARYILVMRPRTHALLEALHDGTDRDRAAVEALFRAHGVEPIS